MNHPHRFQLTVNGLRVRCFAVMFAWLVSACGPTSATSPLAACALPVEQAIELPANFAPRFPFPPGMHLYKFTTLNDDPTHTHMQVVGAAPLSLKESAQFLVGQLPQAGYKLGYGESEPNEIEAQFDGHGWAGSFIITAIPNCTQVSTWTVRVLKL